jgi:hypothetical protein
MEVAKIKEHLAEADARMPVTASTLLQLAAQGGSCS